MPDADPTSSACAAVGRIAAVPKILRLIVEMTGLRLALVAQVTDRSWTCCAVQDDLGFGLAVGGELDLETTLCNEVRQTRTPIAISHASTDPTYCEHPTPKMYAFESYISVPIFLRDGSYFGNLCALDSSPAKLDARTVAMFEVYADLVGSQLDDDAHMVAALREQLQRTEARMQAVFASLDDGYCVMEMIVDERGETVDYRFLEANAAFERQTGLVNAIGKTARELVPTLDESWFRLYGRVAATGEIARFENHAPAMGRWFDAYATRVGAAELRQVALVFKDITERKQAEAERERAAREVAHARARLHACFMQAPVAVSIVSGPEFVFELANPRYLELIGRTDVVGKTSREVFWELPEDAPVFQIFRQVYATAETFTANEFAVKLVRTAGAAAEDVYFMFATQPIGNADGRVSEIMTVAVDVTEQVIARRKVEALMNQLQQADHRKDEFLATLAHELRNPMAAISGALAMIQRSAHDDAKLEKYHATAERQMHHLARIVDDLLDVARITRGNVDLRKENVDLATIVADAVTTSRAAVEARGHQLTVTTEPGAFPIVADATRIEQVLVNLISNATKYTDPGGTIEVRLEREGSDTARVAMRDSGRGIPPEMLSSIFDIFTQVSPSIDRRSGGLGLGLALVKRLVELHDGSVRALSEGVGKGSEFQIRLPLADAAVVTPNAEPASDVARAKRRVLIVEDSDDAREMLQELLLCLGHEAYIARDGAEGVKELLRLRPDIALVDVGLPVIDGYEVARQVRAELGADVKMVAVTGYGGHDVTEKALQAGFDAHIIKPLNVDALVSLLA